MTNDESNQITTRDLEKARLFLLETFENELSRKEDQVAPGLIKKVYNHSLRVAELARWIAAGEHLDSDALEMAGILHDVARLSGKVTGGIVTLPHAHLGAAITFKFLTEEREKSKELANQIARMIGSHIYCSFTKTVNLKEVVTPEKPEEWALRDADLLDYVDWRGILYSVELRQQPRSHSWNEDLKGNIFNAISRTLIHRGKIISDIATDHRSSGTAFKLCNAMKKRGDTFYNFYRARRVDSLQDFRRLADEFHYLSLGEDFWNKSENLRPALPDPDSNLQKT